MKTDTEKNSLKLDTVACADNLEEKVIECIRTAQKRKAKLHLEFFGVSFLALVSFFAFVTEKIFVDFSTSPFYQYASVLVTDSKFALMNWKQTSLLLLESAPVLDLFLIVSMLCALLYILSKTTKEASVYLRPKLIYK